MTNHTSKAELTRSVGHTFDYAQLDAFLPAPPPTSRTDDLDTAKAAGAIFESEVGNGLRLRVLEAFRLNGPMTDETLERLPAFKDCGASTIRKRRSELFHMVPQRIVLYGTTTNRRGKTMKVWALA